MIRCEALAMDEEFHVGFGLDDERVPDCMGEAGTERRGFHLCAGCAEAFDLLVELGARIAELGGEA